MYANISQCSIRAYVNNCLPFSSWLITSNFSLILFVFHRFLTFITLGDAYLCFSFIFVPKANDAKRGITQATYLYHKRNLPVHVTDGMTLLSLSAGLENKTSVAKFNLCQTETEHYHVNWKRCVQVPVTLKRNHAKKKRPACT